MTHTPNHDHHGLMLSELTKSYGDKTVLHSVDLAVEPGEFVSLLGPSGCGKSTALKIIGGFETATSGSVHIGGADMTRVPAKQRGTGIVFQQYSLFPHLTAAQNIEFGLKVRRQAKQERRRTVDELLSLVGLETHGSRYPHQLSGGQQQRIALARALAVEPKVLLLDEPLSALDARVRERLRDEITRIHRERGTTTIMVTHDQEEALAMADRVAVMHEGRIAQFATPEAIYSSPEPGFVAGFIGVMNRVTPDAVSAEDVRVLGSRIAREHATLDEFGQVLLRPEDLRLDPSDTGRSMVTDLTLRGGFTSATVLLSGLEQSVRVDMPTGEAARLRRGDRVDVGIAAHLRTSSSLGAAARASSASAEQSTPESGRTDGARA